MNHPDAYFPFYQNEFFQAIEGLPDLVSIAYLRAISYYWAHNHCVGLEDDDEFLRRLCRVERDEWPNTKPIIFGRFFKLVAGLWHQKRAQEEWAKATRLYAKRFEQTKAATAARIKNK